MDDNNTVELMAPSPIEVISEEESKREDEPSNIEEESFGAAPVIKLDLPAD